MLKSWLGERGAGNVTVHDVSQDTMRLSLHIISKAGFGIRLAWPGRSSEKGRAASDEVPAGHRLSFKDALSGVIDNIVTLLVLPHWLLSE